MQKSRTIPRINTEHVLSLDKDCDFAPGLLPSRFFKNRFLYILTCSSKIIFWRQMVQCARSWMFRRIVDYRNKNFKNLKNTKRREKKVEKKPRLSQR